MIHMRSYTASIIVTWPIRMSWMDTYSINYDGGIVQHKLRRARHAICSAIEQSLLQYPPGIKQVLSTVNLEIATGASQVNGNGRIMILTTYNSISLLSASANAAA
jgi:hypothetical protein